MSERHWGTKKPRQGLLPDQTEGKTWAEKREFIIDVWEEEASRLGESFAMFRDKARIEYDDKDRPHFVSTRRRGDVAPDDRELRRMRPSPRKPRENGQER